MARRGGGVRRVLVVRSRLICGDDALLMRVVSDCKRCAQCEAGLPRAGLLVSYNASSTVQKAGSGATGPCRRPEGTILVGAASGAAARLGITHDITAW